LNLRDLIRVLRSRWITVAVATLTVVLGAVALTLLTTPTYQASTRLFVSTTVGASANDLYQGNRLSQERVISYTQLLLGETLAQRTIDKLQLDVSAKDLVETIRASSKLDTVLIDVDVDNESPIKARDIANALSDEFVMMVRELETPIPGAKPDARVVVEQRASIPIDPISPKPARNLAIGLLLGVFLGVAIAIARDFFDNTVKDFEEMEAITGAGLIGNIPLDAKRENEPAIQFDGDNSPIAEAFRKLRTNLQFLMVDSPPRVIVVTSSLPSEGKSTTAVNIALALAEAELNVVIVDGDLRRPTLNKYLDAVGTVGFSTALSGRASLSEVLQKTRFPNLMAITAGTIPPNPSELLGSQAAKRILSELREQFDYVIIDSPPLLAVTDGAILATSSDGVLIVGRFGVVRRDQLGHAVGTLREIGANLLGAVFTLTPTRGGGYYNYNYNYDYYGYNQKQEAPATFSAVAEGELAKSADIEVSASDNPK